VDLETTILNNGTKVLAKHSQGRPAGITYSNRTQANARVTKLVAAHIKAYVYQPRLGPVFYIAITSPDRAA
jgi:hypothetical protein